VKIIWKTQSAIEIKSGIPCKFILEACWLRETYIDSLIGNSITTWRKARAVDAGNGSGLLKFDFTRTRSGQMIIFSVRF